MPRVKLAAATYANNDLRDLIDGRRRYLRITIQQLLQTAHLTKFEYYKIIHNPQETSIDNLRSLQRALHFSADEQQTIFRCIFC